MTQYAWLTHAGLRSHPQPTNSHLLPLLLQPCCSEGGARTCPGSTASAPLACNSRGRCMPCGLTEQVRDGTAHALGHKIFLACSISFSAWTLYDVHTGSLVLSCASSRCLACCIRLAAPALAWLLAWMLPTSARRASVSKPRHPYRLPLLSDLACWSSSLVCSYGTTTRVASSPCCCVSFRRQGLRCGWRPLLVRIDVAAAYRRACMSMLWCTPLVWPAQCRHRPPPLTAWQPKPCLTHVLHMPCLLQCGRPVQ